MSVTNPTHLSTDENHFDNNWDYDILVDYLSGTSDLKEYSAMPTIIEAEPLIRNIQEITAPEIFSRLQHGTAVSQFRTVYDDEGYIDYKVPVLIYQPSEVEQLGLHYTQYFPPEPVFLHEYFLNENAFHRGDIGALFVSRRLKILILRTKDTIKYNKQEPAPYRNYHSSDFNLMTRIMHPNKAATSSTEAFLRLCNSTGLVPYYVTPGNNSQFIGITSCR